PEEALAFLNANAGVDVLFLDIQMPGLTGFQMLEKLDRQIPVVFTTAYDRYALDAFEVNSVDYLLKPIEADRLDRCLDKLERFGGREPASGHTDSRPSIPDIRALARQLAAELRGREPAGGQTDPRPLARIASRVGERTTILDVARVSHFFSKDKLTF